MTRICCLLHLDCNLKLLGLVMVGNENRPAPWYAPFPNVQYYLACMPHMHPFDDLMHYIQYCHLVSELKFTNHSLPTIWSRHREQWQKCLEMLMHYAWTEVLRNVWEAMMSWVTTVGFVCMQHTLGGARWIWQLCSKLFDTKVWP